MGVRYRRRQASVAGAALVASLSVQATDIGGVQWFAIDQPQVEVSLFPGGHGDGDAPLTGTDLFGDPTTNFSAFLDTGAGGIVFSELTADRFGIGRQDDGAGNLVTFGDVGVAGSAVFNVSIPLDVSARRYVSPLLGGNGGPPPMATLGSIRAQIGPLNAGAGSELPGVPGEIINPGDVLGLLGDINIVGMPAIQSRVLVMDPKGTDDPLQALTGGLGTWLYSPGTSFTNIPDDPGIPSVGRHVQLSFADFDPFNTVTPSGGPRPTSRANPMIGSNRLTDPAQGSPGVTVRLGNAVATGSFLLDTGAQSSFISTGMAAQLGVRNRRGPNGELLPDLEAFDARSGTYVDIPEFVTDIGGIGGSTQVAGFNLSSLLLRTTEGDPADENDPAHLRFLDAPVFVLDIPVGEGASRFTLDGVLGMNYLVASVLFDLQAFSISGNLADLFSEFRPGAFDWLVIDTVAGQLGLNLKAAAVPLPGSLLMMAGGLVALASRRRRRGSIRTTGAVDPFNAI